MNPLKKAGLKFLPLVALAVFACHQKAGGAVLFSDDFEPPNDGIGAWQAKYWTPPVDSIAAVVADPSNPGNHVLRAAQESFGGVMVVLDTPVTIDSSVSTVTVQLDIRSSGYGGGQVGVALTDQTSQTPTGGNLFSGSIGSGIQIIGSGYANIPASKYNQFSWGVDGAVTADTTVVPALLTGFNVWNTWTIVYHVAGKKQTLYVNGNSVFSQTGVDLTGVTLNSLWLRQGGTNSLEQPNYYDNIQVSFQAVPEPGSVALAGGGLGLLALGAFRSRNRRAFFLQA